MTKYLLDTDICIFFFKGKYGIDERMKKAGIENCYISEITLAELKYGAENSGNPPKHRKIVTEFQQKIQIIPIFSSLNLYAEEKSRLKKLGTPIDDFDILIGATALFNNLVMITNNVKHFQRIKDIKIENWIKN